MQYISPLTTHFNQSLRYTLKRLTFPTTTTIMYHNWIVQLRNGTYLVQRHVLVAERALKNEKETKFQIGSKKMSKIGTRRML